jgi:hypothetical protein
MRGPISPQVMGGGAPPSGASPLVVRARRRVRIGRVVLVAAAMAGPSIPVAAQTRCESVGPVGIHACLRGGEEPVLVLAAGAGQDSRTWGPVVGALAAFATVVTFDRPGLGRSPPVAGPS